MHLYFGGVGFPEPIQMRGFHLLVFTPLIIGTLWLGVQPGAVLDITGPAVELLTTTYRAAIGG